MQNLQYAETGGESMKQLETINSLKTFLPQCDGIRGALLIGSFARATAKWSSDIDLSFWISPEFDAKGFIRNTNQLFGDKMVFGNYSAYRKHLTLYFSDHPKVDISIFSEIDGLDQFFLGSEIKEVEQSILYDPEDALSDPLKRIVSRKANSKKWELAEELAIRIDKFIYDFEQFSEAHRRSDAWRSHYYYNIALNSAVQIFYLARGNREFAFLPKNLTSLVLRKEELESFYALRGTLYLPEVNEVKRRLILFVMAALKESNGVETERIAEIESFLEYVYRRDYLWNFRDLSEINPLIRPGRLFRSSSLAQYQEDDFLLQFLAGKSITTIIDLRENDEVATDPYHTERMGGINRVHIPVDPRVQSEAFRKQHVYGSNVEIAYRYFALECKPQILRFFKVLAGGHEGAIVTHCHAGKDRTGVLITLLHLLSGADQNTIEMSYTASEMDTQMTYLREFLNIIEQQGGIIHYLTSCGVTERILEEIQSRYFINRV